MPGVRNSRTPFEFEQPTLFELDEMPAPDSLSTVGETIPNLTREHGRVYTRQWLVRFILDLAGYTEDRDLAALQIIEPAVGDGAFLVEIARRLVRSCRRFERSLADIRDCVAAFEKDAGVAAEARLAACEAIVGETRHAVYADPGAAEIADHWVRVGDFLSAARSQPSTEFVIGNPPYIRLENADSSLMAKYRATYHTMRGRADLYVGFYEAALRLLKPGGICAFVCADRWMRNQYGADLRRFITHGPYEVLAVAEMQDGGSFEDAVSAYPAVTVIRRQPSTRNAAGRSDGCRPTIVARASKMAAELEEANPGSLARALETVRSGGVVLSDAITAAPVSPWFAGDQPWPHVSPERLALLRRLEMDFPPLEDTVTGTRVGIGVATGADRVFITKSPAVFEAVEPECLVPLALTGDVKPERHVAEWSGHYLLDPGGFASEIELEHRFPRLCAYLRSSSGMLRSRHVAAATPRRWFRTIDRVDKDLTCRVKLYLPDIRGRIAPVLDAGKTYPHHNLYFVISDAWDIEVLGGLLMSDIAQFFVECYAIRMRGGYLRFQAQYLRRIRVPHRESVTPGIADELRSAFRKRDVSLATSVTCRLFGIGHIPLNLR